MTRLPCHKAVCFSQFNSATSSSGQCITRGFFWLISFKGGGGWRLYLSVRKISCMLRSQKQQQKETDEPYSWMQEWNLLNWDSSHFALISGPLVGTEREGSSRYIPAVPWCAGAALESALRTGIPVGAAASAEVSLQEENWKTRARWNCCCSPPRLWGEQGSSWASKGSGSPPASALLGMNPSGKSGTRIARSHASHRHRGWVKNLIYFRVKNLIYFNAAVEAF